MIEYDNAGKALSTKCGEWEALSKYELLSSSPQVHLGKNFLISTESHAYLGTRYAHSAHSLLHTGSGEKGWRECAEGQLGSAG